MKLMRLTRYGTGRAVLINPAHLVRVNTCPNMVRTELTLTQASDERGSTQYVDETLEQVGQIFALCTGEDLP